MRGILTLEEDGKEQRHEFKDRAVVGRDFDCDVILQNRSVSRKHAVLEHGPQGWVLRDLQSVNGTWVKGARIKEAPIASGERVRFGDVKALFESISTSELSSVEKIKQTLSVKPTRKMRPLAGVVLTILGLLMLIGVTIYQKRCSKSASTMRGQAPHFIV